MNPTWIEIAGTVCFALAVLHTFTVKTFHHAALRCPKDSVRAGVFHLLGEVEIVFGLWSAVVLAVMLILKGPGAVVEFLESRNFTEAQFVFVIMAVAATQPVLVTASAVIAGVARCIPLPKEAAFFVAAMIAGPLLGSFITEPAAMTVTALLLRQRFFSQPVSEKLKYAALGLLFVNVSIGGVLTPYAAPPVLMVASTWNWDIAFMLRHFGWKVAVAVVCNTALITWIFRHEFRKISQMPVNRGDKSVGTVPYWVQGLHLVFLALVVMTAHHSAVFLGLFLFFLGVTVMTKKYQQPLKLRESLLVGFFLGGLVVLGSFQGWWLGVVLQHLKALPLFIGATALTSITDNAALTYLASQVQDVSAEFQYAIVAGAIAGGGLTVIANAPNPAGFAVLQDRFGAEGISPLKLLLGALGPTVVAMACLWLFPH